MPRECCLEQHAGVLTPQTFDSSIEKPLYGLQGISLSTLMSKKYWRHKLISIMHSLANNHRTLLLCTRASIDGWRTISPLIMFTLKNLLVHQVWGMQQKRYLFLHSPCPEHAWVRILIG